MKSKASFFNGAVFRSDCKRLWWVGALHTAFLLVSCIMPFFMNVFLSSASSAVPSTASFLFHKSEAAFAIQLLLPAGLCVLLFSYLHNGSVCTSLHGMPLCRRTLYVSHCTAGLFLLTVPVILNGLILLCGLANPHIAFVLSARHIGAWVSVQLVYTLLFFSITAFVGMFTGNSVAHLIFPYIFACLPMFLWMLGHWVITAHLYGYYSFSASRGLVFLYHTPFKLIHYGYAIPMYLILSVLLLTGAYLAYKLRPLENCGEIIVFPKLRPVFIFGVALCAGFLGYCYTRHFWQSESIFILLVFGLPGLLIAHMLSRRALTFRGFLRPCLGFCIFILALFCVFRFDLTGYERRIPALDSIAGVSLKWPENPERDKIYINGRWATESEPYDSVMTDPADIQNVISLHKYKLENRKLPSNPVNIPISYILKNGKTIRRFYALSIQTDSQYLAPVWNAEKTKKSHFPILDGTEKNITDITISDSRLISDQGYTYPEAQDRLLAALEKDLRESTLLTSFVYERALTKLDIQYTKPLTFLDTGEPVDNKNNALFGKRSMHIPILSSYKNTISLLQELGFYDNLLTPEDITIISADAQDAYHGEISSAMTTDPAEIAEIYNYINTRYLSGGDEQILDKWISLNFAAGNTSFRYETAITDDLPTALCRLLG